MDRFGTVLRFELVRTLRKRSFWIGALALPVLVIVIAALQFFSAQTTAASSEAQREASMELRYLDESGVVNPDIAAELGGSPIEDAEEGRELVAAGEIDAFIHYPADLIDDHVTVVGKHLGVFADGTYSAIATSLLQASAEGAIDSPALVAIVRGSVPVDTTTYLPDGSVSRAVESLPIGLVLVVLLFLTVVVLANPLLVATTEEKENRVAEILLVTANPTTVISAKLLAYSLVGLIQMGLVALLAVLGWLVFRDELDFGAVDLSTIVVDPQMLLVGIPILLGAAALFIGMLAAVGASAPSAKEAGGFTGAAIMVPLIPLYLFGLIISSPNSPLVEVLTYLPFTAGTTSLIRNAFGVLPLWQGLLVALILFLSAAAMIWLAVRAFRRGALEYGRMLNWRELLR